MVFVPLVPVTVVLVLTLVATASDGAVLLPVLWLYVISG
jgi:hypothetical protein